MKIAIFLKWADYAIFQNTFPVTYLSFLFSKYSYFNISIFFLDTDTLGCPNIYNFLNKEYLSILIILKIWAIRLISSW